MGGLSAEREISLVTGQAVCKNLDRKKYQVLPIEYGRDFRFYLLNGQKKSLMDLYELKQKVDLVFIALHGTYGEDGGVQGLCECLNIKYTGSNVLSSAVCMNKALAGRIYQKINLPHPEFLDFTRAGWRRYKRLILKNIARRIRYPAVIKPVDQGSAVGVYIVQTQTDLVNKIKLAGKKFDWLMVQRFIKGQEATCGVLEKRGEPVALPPTHIKPVLGQFYDYKAKYAKGGSIHVCPADFSKAINKKLKEYAVIAHQTFACRSMSRTDFLVTDRGKIFVIETNTIPGMTLTSLLPEAAGKVGISFSKMLDLIIEASL